MDEFMSLPTDEAMQRFEQERLINGFIFPLKATSAGMPQIIHARVRRLNTIDRAALETLPDDLQKTVFDGLREFQKEQKKLEGLGEPENMAEMFSNNQKILNAANAWCMGAFINPRVYIDDRERADAQRRETDPAIRHWHIERVAAEDRVAVFIMCLDADSPQVAKLKMFRPEPRLDVQNGEIGEHAAPTERNLELVGERV